MKLQHLASQSRFVKVSNSPTVQEGSKAGTCSYTSNVFMEGSPFGPYCGRGDTPEPEPKPKKKKR